MDKPLKSFLCYIFITIGKNDELSLKMQRSLNVRMLQEPDFQRTFTLGKRFIQVVQVVGIKILHLQ